MGRDHKVDKMGNLEKKKKKKKQCFWHFFGHTGAFSKVFKTFVFCLFFYTFFFFKSPDQSRGSARNKQEIKIEDWKKNEFC